MNPSGRMRRVLIITYYWPPSGGAGVQRWLKFSKYLRGYGWEPVIYTPENPEAPTLDDSLFADIPEGIEIIKRPILEPYSIYKRLVGMKKEDKVNAGFLSETEKPGLAENISIWLRGNLFIPDARRFWIRPSVRFLEKYLALHPVEAIVSTGPPHSMHMIALKIHKKSRIPWLADFRDPWTGIDFYHQLKLTRYADRLHHKLERAVLREADAVTVVSQRMAGDFARLWTRDYELVMNGYDHEDMLQMRGIHPEKKFSLAHIGSLAPARNPETLWSVIAERVSNDANFAAALSIKLVGKVDISVLKTLEHLGLSPYLQKTDYLPHDQVLKEISRSQVLLLLINQVPNAEGIVTGKLFEYLASGRPILNIGPVNGDAASIIRDCGAGTTVDFNDREGIQKVIGSLFSAYTAGQPLSAAGAGEMFSREALTGKIAGILNRITV